MPKKNGLDVIKHIKKPTNKSRKANILVVSSNKNREIVTECLRAGANNFLQKPFNPNVVEVKIKEAIIDILRVENQKEEMLKDQENITRDEINIELLLHKLRMFLVQYSEESEIKQKTMNDISLFLDRLPVFIEDDDEFKLDFFGENSVVRIERELLKEGIIVEEKEKRREIIEQEREQRRIEVEEHYKKIEDLKSDLINELKKGN